MTSERSPVDEGDSTTSHRWVPDVGLWLVAAGLALPLVSLLRLDRDFPVRVVRSDDVISITSAAAGTAAAVLIAAVIGGVVSTRLPARWAIPVGALGAGAGLGAAAAVDDPTVFLVLLVITAAGGAVSVVHHRSTLVGCVDDESCVRRLSRWWCAAGIGALVGLVAEVWWSPADADVLRAGGGLTGLGAAVCFAVMGSIVVESPARLAGAFRHIRPGMGRMAALWFGFGFLLLGAAPSARRFMDQRWALDAGGQAALVGGAVLVGVLTLALGHWWWDPARLTRVDRPRIIGTSAAVGAALIGAGSWSFTYPGLVGAWLVAGGALAVAVLVLDVAGMADLDPVGRAEVAVVQLVGLATGALAGGLILSAWDGGRAGMVAAALPLVVIGFFVQRGAVVPAEPEVSTVERPLPAAVSVIEDAPLLRCEHLDVAYGTVPVLFDVSLDVREGELVALLGTNGAGKTTLLKTIAGLLQPTRGRVRFNGVDVTTFPADWMPGLGLSHVAGGDSLAGALTVEDSLRMFAQPVDPDYHAVRIDRAFEVFPRLLERKTQTVSTLSGGEKQMLALAKAFVQEPRVLLIDEFSLGLAPLIVTQLVPVIADLNRAGTAVLLVEQSISTALDLADRALCIEKGEIVFSGSGDELRSRPDLIETAYLEGIAKALAE
ncbi:MAG: ATP-binding cassette domain-containing protein [Acidimicrobiales bacterium]